MEEVFSGGQTILGINGKLKMSLKFHGTIPIRLKNIVEILLEKSPCRAEEMIFLHIKSQSVALRIK